MNDDAERLAAQKALEAHEARVVFNRIRELQENPIQGNFDTEHLKAVHAYIFQDLPHHRPGVTREDTDDWVKHRALEGEAAVYDVPYRHMDIEKHIDETLREFGGAEALKGLSPDETASRIAKLYGDLDHTHGFYEGNSRTLREFTREIAEAAGYELDWVKTGIGAKERNELYIARDIEVINRAYPDLTEERAMKTNDRAEYEAFFTLTDLRRAAGEKTLDTIIASKLNPQRSNEKTRTLDQAKGRDSSADGLRVVDKATGIVMSLFSFVDSLLGGKPALPPEGHERIRAQRSAMDAMERIRESRELGEDLSASDVSRLLPTQLENIKAKGDDYVRELIQNAERDRARYLGGRER